MHSHTFTVAYGTPIHKYTHMYAFTCTLMGECTHTWIFRVAPVLSDPRTKDLLPHRMAVVTKCRRVSWDRLTEAAYGRNCCSALGPRSPKEQPGLG